jgi:ABC-type antimicrobial peptide transport system permease subunit
MAARFWPGRSPLGETFLVKGRPLRVVGVAKTSKYKSISEPPTPFFYVPLAQNFSPTAALFVRTGLAPAEMGSALGAALRAVDPNLAHYEVTTMGQQVESSTSSQRVAVLVLEIFGGLALVLAGIGLYGVLSYAVSQRTHEMGLRMALGASSRDLLRLVASQGMALTAAGIAAGLAAAVPLTRLMQNLIWGVSPRDPAVFASSAAVLVAAAVAACAFPAWRAVRLDPWRALRE